MIRLGQRVQDLLFQLHLKQERIDALESGEEYIRMEERLHRELAYQDRIIKDLVKMSDGLVYCKECWEINMRLLKRD